MLARRIKVLLAVLICVYAVICVMTGLLGYRKLTSNASQLQGVLDGHLMPVTQLAQFKRIKEEIYEGLQDSILDHSKHRIDAIRRLRADMIQTWNGYYASGVTTRSEASLAREIDETMPHYIASLDRVVSQLEAGDFERARRMTREELHHMNHAITRGTKRIYDQNAVQAGDSSQDVARSAQRLVLLFSGFMLLAVAAAGVASLAMFNLLMRPLHAMSRIASAISRDKLNEPAGSDAEMRKVEALIRLVRDIR